MNNTKSKTEYYGFKVNSGLDTNKVKMNFVNILIRLLLVIFISISCVNIWFSTLNIDFSFTSLCSAVILVSAICVLMYFNGIVALILLFLGIGGIGYYIVLNFENLKLGILSIFNDGYSVVRNSFGLPYADGFEAVQDMNLSDEVSVIIILSAIIVALVSSYFVGKYMSIIYISIMTVLTIGFCSFLENENSPGSIILLVICMIIVICIKLTKTDKILQNDGWILSELIGLILVFFAVLYFIFGLAADTTGFSKIINSSDLKDYVKYTVKDVMVLKYAEYKDFVIQDTTDVGQLSFFGCIKPRVVNKFHIKLDPIKDDKLYLRSFVGSDYIYRGNTWNSNTDITDVNFFNSSAKALENSDVDYNEIEFRSDSQFSFDMNIYLPYYTDIEDYSEFNYIDDCNIEGSDTKEYSVKAYEYSEVNVDDTEYYEFVKSNYLKIDNRNKQIIEDILESANINRDDNNINEKISEYFKSNFVYDFDSGVVPFGEDFVNYFLLDNKKGNFSHFASAATLMYRTMGIPARYVGGYALDKEQILAGRYDGKGRLSVHIKNANTYAWVEVYEKGFGWIPVDVSPSPSFLEIFEKYGEDAEENLEETKDTDILNEYFKPIENKFYNPMNLLHNFSKMIMAIIILLALVIVALLFLKKLFDILLWNFKYSKASDDIKGSMLMERLRIKLNADYAADYTLISKLAYKKGLSISDAIKLSELSNKIVYGKTVDKKDLFALKKIISDIK